MQEFPEHWPGLRSPARPSDLSDDSPPDAALPLAADASSPGAGPSDPDSSGADPPGAESSSADLDADDMPWGPCL